MKLCSEVAVEWKTEGQMNRDHSEYWGVVLACRAHSPMLSLSLSLSLFRALALARSHTHTCQQQPRKHSYTLCTAVTVWWTLESISNSVFLLCWNVRLIFPRCCCCCCNPLQRVLDAEHYSGNKRVLATLFEQCTRTHTHMEEIMFVRERGRQGSCLFKIIPKRYDLKLNLYLSLSLLSESFKCVKKERKNEDDRVACWQSWSQCHRGGFFQRGSWAAKRRWMLLPSKAALGNLRQRGHFYNHNYMKQSIP